MLAMTYHRTMARAKISITVDESVLATIDQLVADGVFPSRSKVFEIAVQDRNAKVHRSRLALECAKLDPVEERALAEESSVPRAISIGRAR
jgi:Arc/MetJ-type ribon-helix-helix transcriptional regulator